MSQSISAIASSLSNDEANKKLKAINDAKSSTSDFSLIPFKNANIELATDPSVNRYPYYDSVHKQMRYFVGSNTSVYNSDGTLSSSWNGSTDSYRFIYLPFVTESSPSSSGDNKPAVKLTAGVQGLAIPERDQGGRGCGGTCCSDWRCHIPWRQGGMNWTHDYSDDSHQWTTRLGGHVKSLSQYNWDHPLIKDNHKASTSRDENDGSNDAHGCYVNRSVYKYGNLPRLRNEELVYSTINGKSDRSNYDVVYNKKFNIGGGETVECTVSSGSSTCEDNRYSISLQPKKNGWSTYKSFSGSTADSINVNYSNLSTIIDTLKKNGRIDSTTAGMLDRLKDNAKNTKPFPISSKGFNSFKVDISKPTPTIPPTIKPESYNIKDFVFYSNQSPDFYNVIKENAKSDFSIFLKNFISSTDSIDVKTIQSSSANSYSYIQSDWQQFIKKVSFKENVNGAKEDIAVINFPSISSSMLKAFKVYLLKAYNDVCYYLCNNDVNKAKLKLKEMLTSNGNLFTEAIGTLFAPSLIDIYNKTKSLSMVGKINKGVKFFTNTEGADNPIDFNNENFSGFRFAAVPSSSDKGYTEFGLPVVSACSGIGDSTLSNKISVSSFPNLEAHLPSEEATVYTVSNKEFAERAKCGGKNVTKEVLVDVPFTFSIYLNGGKCSQLKTAYVSNAISNTQSLNPCAYEISGQNGQFPTVEITNAAMAKCSYNWSYVDWKVVKSVLENAGELMKMAMETDAKKIGPLTIVNNGEKGSCVELNLSGNDYKGLREDINTYGYSKLFTSYEPALAAPMGYARQQNVHSGTVYSKKYCANRDCFMGCWCGDERTESAELWLPKDRIIQLKNKKTVASLIKEKFGGVAFNGEPACRFIDEQSWFVDGSVRIPGNFKYKLLISGMDDMTGRTNGNLCPSTILRDTYFFSDELYKAWARMLFDDKMLIAILKDILLDLTSNISCYPLAKMDLIFKPYFNSIESGNWIMYNLPIGPACIYNSASFILPHQYYMGECKIMTEGKDRKLRWGEPVETLEQTYNFLDMSYAGLVSKSGVSINVDSVDDECAIVIRTPKSGVDMLTIPRMQYLNSTSDEFVYVTYTEKPYRNKQSMRTSLADMPAIAFAEKFDAKATGYLTTQGDFSVPKLTVKYDTKTCSRTVSLSTVTMKCWYNPALIHSVSITNKRIEIDYVDSVKTRDNVNFLKPDEEVFSFEVPNGKRTV